MENNKRIAEFMGYESYKFRGYTMFVYEENNHRADIDLQYLTSWDWLMPVVNKCMQTGDNTDEWDALSDALSTINITNVYEAVVEFIKFYNQNK
tara:strand:+ start:6821 stop:7102 length:282 start_codon:yes stop_codon:yes gene_type:complete